MRREQLSIIRPYDIHVRSARIESKLFIFIFNLNNNYNRFHFRLKLFWIFDFHSNEFIYQSRQTHYKMPVVPITFPKNPIEFLYIYFFVTLYWFMWNSNFIILSFSWMEMKLCSRGSFYYFNIGQFDHVVNLWLMITLLAFSVLKINRTTIGIMWFLFSFFFVFVLNTFSSIMYIELPTKDAIKSSQC